MRNLYRVTLEMPQMDSTGQRQAVCELAVQSMMGENKNPFICMLTMVE
jgi:hypothetical protein